MLRHWLVGRIFWRRAALAVLLGLFAAAALSAPEKPDPTALVERAIAAHGGRAALEATQASETLEGDLEIFSPIQNKAHVVVRRKGDRILAEVRVGGIEAKICLDGRRGWKQMLGSVSDLSAEEFGEQKMEQEHEIDLLLKASSPGYTLIALGKRKLPDGAEGEVVRVTPPKGASTDFYLDPTTGLVAAIGFRGRNFSRGVEVDQLVRMLDYRELEGGRVSFLQKSYEDWRLTESITLTRVDTKTPIPDSIFVRPGTAAGAGGQPMTVPFDFQTGLILVRASVNGGPPRRFLVDTGASITVLLSDVADDLGLKPSGSLNAGAGGGAVAARLARLESLSVGTATARDLDVGIFDLGPLTTAFDGGIAGLLGANFLSRFQVTIDYGLRRMTLAPDGAPVPSGRSVRMDIHGGVPVVDAQVGLRRFRMLMDTGATSTTLPPRFAATLRLTGARQVTAIGADGKPVRMRAVRLPALTAAGQTVRGLVVDFTRPTGPSGSQLGDSATGLLGNTFLRRFRVTLDYRRQRAVFAPSLKPTTFADEWTHAGAELSPRPGGEAVVMVVQPGSPAARAGIRVGDRVVAIDGRPVRTSSPLVLAGIMCGPADSSVRLTIQREGERRTYRLRRVRLL
jgi:predicted aspartyl protease